jgi:hypothetical protein
MVKNKSLGNSHLERLLMMMDAVGFQHDLEQYVIMTPSILVKQDAFSWHVLQQILVLTAFYC